MSVDYRPDYDPADVDSDYGHTGGDITVPTFTANMKPFRFWCQKALPLVYDDSLSYYEVLCKVVKQMNDFLTDLQTATGAIDQFAQQFVINQQFLNKMADQLGQNIEDLETYINERMTDFMTAYTQLQDYVNNYFDNLDVQQEINNKLDEMASDGTFNDLFDPVVTAWMTAKTAQIDAAIAGQDAIQAQQNGRISVLEGRMDTFSSLPSGSTSGNAELLDIRTNFLGEVYPTAGEAVRASDMIASGFQSISATKLEEWDGNDNSSVYDTIQIDISGYKGGHVVVIGSFKYFQSDLTTTGTCSVYATNTPGKVEDANAVNYLPGITNSIFKDFTQLTTSISGEERLLLQFAIPDDYAYQYLKIGHFEHNAITGSYTEPLYIVYANSWSRTPVDDTLTIAGDAADAKAAGDALDELNERLSDDQKVIKNVVGFSPIINRKYENTGSGTYWVTDPIPNATNYSELYFLLYGTIDVLSDTPAIIDIRATSGTKIVSVTELNKWYKFTIPSDYTEMFFRLQHGGTGSFYSAWDIVVAEKPISYKVDNVETILNVNELNSLELRQGAYYADGYYNVGNRVTTNVLYFPYAVDIITPHKTLVIQWGSANITGGFSEAEYAESFAVNPIRSIPAYNYVTLTFANNDDSNITPSQIQYKIVKHDDTYTQYSYLGEEIPAKKNAYFVKKIPLKFTAVTGKGVIQGMVQDSNYIYQFYTAGYVQVYDINTYEYVNGYDIPVGHANSVSYSNGLYYAFDVDNTAYAFTMDNDEYEIIKKLKFNDGYYTYGVANGNKLYTLAYAQNNYRDANNNYMICSVYDLTSYTQNEDNTYTPRLIKQFTLDFIYCIQDMTSFFGDVYALSSYSYDEAPTRIYRINFDDETIKTVVNELPYNLKIAECEGIIFLDKETYYTMVVSATGGYFEFNFNN